MSSMNNERPTRYEYIYEQAFCLTLCLLPVISVLVPRLAGVSAAVAGLVLFSLFRLVYGRSPPIAKAAMIWIVALVGLAGISSLWALDPAAAIKDTTRVALVLLPGGLLIGLCATVSTRINQRLCRLFPLFYIAGTVLLVIEVYCGMPLYRLIHHVPAETYLHPDDDNRSIIFCTLLYIPAVGLTSSLSGQHQTSRWIVTGVFSLALLLVLFKTESQSAQLAWFLAALFAVAFPYRLRTAWYALSGVIVAAILGAPWLAMVMFRTLSAVVNKLPFFGEHNGYGAERLEIWDFVARYSLHRPLYGFGIEATRAVGAFDTKQIYQKGVTVLHPHNFAIQLWMEFGAIGALLAAGMVAHLLWFVLNRMTPAQQRIALPSFMACLSVSAMTYGIWQGWWLGLLVLVTALTRVAPLTPKAKQPQEAENGFR